MTKAQLVENATKMTIEVWKNEGNLNENQQWKKEAIRKNFWKSTKASLISITQGLLKEKYEALSN